GASLACADSDLDCHVRTNWRDVNVLAGAGFLIYDDKAGDRNRTVWRVTDECRRRLPLKLGLAEVLALLLSRDLLAAAGASVLGPDLASALDKIRGLLSPDALRLLDTMREGVGVRAAGAKLQQPPAEPLAHMQPHVRGTLVTVRGAVAKGVAPYSRERLWHPTQKLPDLPDGRLELTVQVADTQEVRRWILGWGAQAEVLQPIAMREALRQEAVAMVE